MTFTKTGTALIIGGSSGMGLAAAKLLAAANIEVLIVGNKHNKLDNALAELKQISRASALQCSRYPLSFKMQKSASRKVNSF